MFDVLLVRCVGKLIIAGYAISGKSGHIKSFDDYPQFYQDMVVRLAAKRACERQNAVVARRLEAV